MNELKDRLKEARELQGLSQNRLSKKLGVSQSAIAAIESGRNKKPTNIARLSEVLGVSPLWLETGKGEMIIAGNIVTGSQNIYGNQSNYTANRDQYNVFEQHKHKETEYNLTETDSHFLKVMPLLDIADGVLYATNPDIMRNEMQSKSDKIATFINHSTDTFGIKMPDDSMESSDEKGIYQGDILVIEPHIQARDNDIVLVEIDGRAVVARLEIELDGSCYLHQYKRSRAPLPETASIRGVIIEIKRRLIASEIVKARLEQAQVKK